MLRKKVCRSVGALFLCVGIYCFTQSLHSSWPFSHLTTSTGVKHDQGHNGAKGNDLPVQENHDHIEQRLTERKAGMKDACAKLGFDATVPGDIIYKRNKYLSKSLFYSDKQKVLMCLIPKCGSRSQATFLGTCEGFGKEAVRHAYQIAEKHLSPRTAKNIKEVGSRIDDYTKIVVVREPLSRLLSAYRDKIEGAGNGPIYQKRYEVIQKWKRKTSALTFSDFIEFIINFKRDPQHDPHWNFYRRLCSPCEIDYTYVVHLDTMEEDIKYISTKMGITNYTVPPSFNAFTDFEKVKRYYKDVPSRLVNDLYRKYKEDFDIFGFPPPPTFWT